MQCRNCEHYSDNEFRYCPRCGAPSSLGWPMAGAPWLRRPAAIAGLGVLIVAWLFALQKALWVPASGPEQGTRMARAAVPVRDTPVPRAPEPKRDTPVKRAPEPERAPLPQRDTPKTQPVIQKPQAVSKQERTERPRPAAARVAPTPSRRAPVTAPSPPAAGRPPVARPRLAVRTRKVRESAVARSVPPSLPPVRRLGQALLADSSDVTRSVQDAVWRPQASPRPQTQNRPTARRQRSRVGSWREQSGPRGSVLSGSPSRSEKPQPQLVAARFERRPPPPEVARSSNLVVNVTARSAGHRTYVYYDGGRMLGIAPLKVRFDRPGRHRLTFWTPRRASRTERTVVVRGRGPQRLAVRMAPTRQLARAD
jgi:hypothetical protein